VHNPYAARLTFPDESTRLRRDQRKYLTLIRAIALLHQHQRPRRIVQGVEHIEVTLDDIATANRLAGEVLGRSLDEMPPQMRRFLDLLHDLVTKSCAEKKCEQRLCLFTQRQARAFTGWSASQVKKHIARLVELEYALPLRAGSVGRGQQIAYELVYTGEGRDGAKFLLGLIDADELRGSLLPLDYDGNREPLKGQWEPPGSPQVAPK
jgi:DNA primase